VFLKAGKSKRAWGSNAACEGILTEEIGMNSAKIELNVERIAVKAAEMIQDAQGVAQAYDAPQLHIVGKAGDLVQGNFGYTGRDGSYYYS
jgi:hypothetical protein